MLVVLFTAKGFRFTWPPETSDYIIFGSWVLLTCGYLLVTIKWGYYTITKESLVQRRFTKELYYFYKDVVFIDEEYSIKNKTLRFVMKNGDVRYLISDKKNILLEEMLKRCKNRLEKEDFSIKYPNVKL